MRDVPHVPRSTNMEMAYFILWLFGGLLYLQSTFACDEDSDCPYAGERCCKSTETGKELAKGICMMRTCGGDVCRTQYDCLPNKRCDASQTSLRSRCTTLCYGDHHCEEIYDTFVVTAKYWIRINARRKVIRQSNWILKLLGSFTFHMQ